MSGRFEVRLLAVESDTDKRGSPIRRTGQASVVIACPHADTIAALVKTNQWHADHIKLYGSDRRS